MVLSNYQGAAKLQLILVLSNYQGAAELQLIMVLSNYQGAAELQLIMVLSNYQGAAKLQLIMVLSNYQGAAQPAKAAKQGSDNNLPRVAKLAITQALPDGCFGLFVAGSDDDTFPCCESARLRLARKASPPTESGITQGPTQKR
jgi:hypothetical protein